MRTWKHVADKMRFVACSRGKSYDADTTDFMLSVVDGIEELWKGGLENAVKCTRFVRQCELNGSGLCVKTVVSRQQDQE